VRANRLCGIASAIPLALLAACQPQLHTSLPQGQTAYAVIEPAVRAVNAGAYALRAGDVVSINVYEEPELSQEKIAIDPRGNLYLPLIGQVQAAGRTQAQLSQELEQAYGQSYLRNPRVAVMIAEVPSNTVSVEGEVTLPGNYPIQPDATLLTAMALAHSPTRKAKLDEVLIYRTVNGERVGARFNLTEIRSGRVPDPQILAGDVVVVGFSAARGIWTDFLEAAPLFNVFTRF
jgi:polysaccharide export outer membrane protein